MVKNLYSSLTEGVDRRRGWYTLPWPLGCSSLLGLRFRLRAANLYDSGRGPLDVPPAGDERHADHLTARTLDGTYNDLEDPLMGALGSRFGRNVPLEHAFPEPDDRLLEPNPRRVSLRAADARRVQAGDDPQPARRRVDPVRGARLVQPRPERDREPVARSTLATDDPGREQPMEIQRTRTRSERRSDRAADLRHRRHALVGRLADLRQRPGVRARDPQRARAAGCGIDAERAAARARSRRTSTSRGVAGNFWVGLALLHALFMLEHNAICDRLHAEHPELDDHDALREGAPRQRGADGEDPHRRLDAGDHRPPDDRARAARELVRAPRRAASTSASAAARARGAPRHPGLAEGAATASRTR